MPQPISYASPLPWYRGRRVRTIIVRLVIVAAIACTSAWLYRLFQQINFLFEQRQWMRYTMPADKIVLTEGTSDVLQLLGTPGYHKVVQSPLDSHQAAASDPPRDLLWAPADTCVFLHGLRVAGHQPRLVSVVVNPQPFFTPGHGYQLLAAAQVPANLLPGSRGTFCASTGDSDKLHLSDTTSLRLFAGQPDPADESHFTIRYDLDGKSTIIDGWLMPDDTVKLEPRK